MDKVFFLQHTTNKIYKFDEKDDIFGSPMIVFFSADI